MKLTDKKLCLGIESTAHTFGIGILDFKGNVLSTVNDTYVPEEGGLHPRKVVEHHTNVFTDVLNKALKDAGCKLKDLNLIAFSQGPGLGPCLRIGAAVGRTLSQKLKIPIVGVNHCIAHIEIGRRTSGLDDPLTLYVSGGNTIVSAFQTGRYRIFGETLDISVGNLIDMVARELNLAHPGGPKIEQLAKSGKKYLPLPYIVKGMDLSFSGIFTRCKRLIHAKELNKEYTVEDVSYSLQETAFAMLTEVTERGLAHTEKKEVLLTGGVAANKRLQDMIRYISEEHNAHFHVVPLKLAGDNGAMIGWAGILYYLNNGGMEIDKTIIEPKWRMDEVFTPWRLNDAKVTGMEFYEKKEPSNQVQNNIELKPIDLSKYNVIKKGAEAALILSELSDQEVLIKYRLEKKYRIPEIDEIIRSSRNLSEARLLMRAKRYEIPVPLVYYIDNKNHSFVMDFLSGKRLKDVLNELPKPEIHDFFTKVGRYLARLHLNNEIHGDLTTSNIIILPNKCIFLIDFGLSYNSATIEDKAVDLHLFKRVIISSHGELFDDIFPYFLNGYKSEYSSKNQDILSDIIRTIEDVESRGRYIKKDKRIRGI